MNLPEPFFRGVFGGGIHSKASFIECLLCIGLIQDLSDQETRPGNLDFQT